MTELTGFHIQWVANTTVARRSGKSKMAVRNRLLPTQDEADEMRLFYGPAGCQGCEYRGFRRGQGPCER